MSYNDISLAEAVGVYVSDIDADENVITLAKRENVMQSECIVTDAHWISGHFPESRASVPLASLSPADSPTVENDRDGRSTFLVQPRYGHRGAPAVAKAMADR